ncbi:MAG: aconitase family protein, partial [Elainellaceae cyanobacterium]
GATREYVSGRTAEPLDAVISAAVTSDTVISGAVPSDAVTSGAVTSDPDARYHQVHRFDLSQLEPQVACPPKPDQVVAVSQLDAVPITRAFVGSCTGGKLHDLAEAAIAIKGQRVADTVSLFVVPASQEVRRQAAALGYLDWLEAAGAQVLKSGCGACINAGLGVLGPQEAGIYATNRNFKGRSGDPTARNYLASPRTVAISAVRGVISA